MSLFLFALLGAVACSETGIDGITDGDNPDDTDDPTGGVQGIPPECDVRISEGGKTRIDADCVRDPWSPPDDPWDVAVEWHVEPRISKLPGSAFGRGVVVTPAVGNLTDDNADGFIDDRDVPEIAFSTYVSNELVVLSGDTGQELWRRGDVLGSAGVGIADVDADGANEIVAMTIKNWGQYAVAVFEADGTLAWETLTPVDQSIYVMNTAADLDGDGAPEVIFDNLVLDGATGELISVLDVWRPQRDTPLRTPVVGDVDLDGEQEILIGPDRFSKDGTREYRHAPALTQSVHTAIANVDEDPEGEIIMLYRTFLEVMDPDGTSLFVIDLPGDNGGPPCVADFDGDGTVEIGIGVGEAVGIYELDGTQKWSHWSVDETVAHAGCSGYDFDDDGAYELLHADQHGFFIFDGRDGTVLFQDGRHTSTTHFEYPVVADVDNDGNAEIVLPSNDHQERGRQGWAGITVFGHAGSGWARSGPTWGIHDFAVTNLGGDGAVPISPRPPWLEHNVFRARPTVDTEALPDLTVEFTDACVNNCETGTVRVSWTAINHGGRAVRVGTRMTLFRLEGFERVPVQELLLPAIPPGTILEGDVFELEPWELGDGLLLTIDDDGDGRGWVEECNDDNNWTVLEDRLCNL